MIAVATGIQMKTIVRVPGVDRNYILQPISILQYDPYHSAADYLRTKWN